MTKHKNEDQQVSEAMEQAALATRRREFKLQPFSEGREFSLPVATREIYMLSQMNVASAIEIGRRLIWAKSSMEHGAFGDWVKEELPFSPVTAWRYMKIADKFKSFTVKDLSLKKIYALAELPDSELKQLEEEGQLGDIMADELDKMTATELRRRLRRRNDERDKLKDDARTKQVVIDSLTETNKDLREGKIYTASEKKLILEADKAVPEFMMLLGRLGCLDRFKTPKVAWSAVAVLRKIAELASIALTNFLDEMQHSDDPAVQRVWDAVEDVEAGGPAGEEKFWREQKADDAAKGAGGQEKGKEVE